MIQTISRAAPGRRTPRRPSGADSHALLFVTALLFWLARVPVLTAQEAVFNLDPAKTRVEFTLDDVLHTVHGSFVVKEGAVHFDPVTGKAGGLIVVDATSGQSGSHARDKKMHRDILESQIYPEISLVPISVTGPLPSAGESRVQLHGLFRIHGAGHEITADVSVRITGNEWTASAHFVVPYVQWGLKNPSTFILRVSDKVEIDIYSQGTVRQ